MSKVDRVLLFAFNHQTVIIELIFAIILGIVVLWLFTNIRGESSDIASSGAHVKDIERALKKVLESTDLRMANSQAANVIKDDEDILVKLGAPGDPTKPAGDPAEVARLKTEMESKAKKLAEVETALAQAKDELTKAKIAGASGVAASAGVAAGGGAPGVNTDELQAKIKSLESRLSEYEIIEDDIANLSLYKEENAKLKAEMSKLKGGAGAELAASVAAGPASSELTPPAAAPVAAAPVAGVVTSSSSPITPAAAGAAPSASAEPDSIDSDTLVKEFDNLVAREKANSEATPATAAPVPTSAAPQAVAPTPAPATSGETGDAGEKLIEEFENFVKGTNT